MEIGDPTFISGDQVVMLVIDGLDFSKFSYIFPERFAIGLASLTSGIVFSYLIARVCVLLQLLFMVIKWL